MVIKSARSRPPVAGIVVASLTFVLIVIAALAHGSSRAATSPASVAATSSAAAVTTSALRVARSLPARGRAPKTGYSRSQFGPAWADTDRDGCDQRNDVLARDLTQVVFRPGTHRCMVVSGLLQDPYTGTTIRFVRGEATSGKVQLDHVVALSDSWQTGAQAWPAAKRLRFATDGMNLLAVDGPANEAKGDEDAATWLPPRRADWCGYVARQVAVKHRYGLWVTAAERSAMVRVLSMPACQTQTLPGTSPPVPVPKAPKSSTSTGCDIAAPGCKNRRP